MATTKVRLELKPRTALLSISAGYVSPYVAETTRLIMNAARIEAPVRTGNLRSLIGMKMRVSRELVVGQVYSKARYSHFVHDATSPHLIRARRAQYLRFEAPPGVVHFRKVVRHPGTKGQPFLREPMRRIGRARDFQVSGYSAASGKVGFGLALD